MQPVKCSIKEAREIADLTQIELAQKVGVSERTLQSYEAGKCLLNIATAQKNSNISRKRY